MKRLFTIFALMCAVFAAGQALAAAKMLTGKGSDIVMTQGYKPSSTLLPTKPDNYPFAVVAGGCFWCVESEFRRIEGVVFTRVGYAGGKEPNPTYEQVSSHQTGHREAVAIYFDPDKVSYKSLIDFFMTRSHDPTQADGQGPDIGYQYTSAIYYVDDEQKQIAQDLLAHYAAVKQFKNPVATQIEPYTTFYDAEDYHQQYYEKYEAKRGTPHMNIWLKQQKENFRNQSSSGQ